MEPKNSAQILGKIRTELSWTAEHARARRMAAVMVETSEGIVVDVSVVKELGSCVVCLRSWVAGLRFYTCLSNAIGTEWPTE